MNGTVVQLMRLFVRSRSTVQVNYSNVQGRKCNFFSGGCTPEGPIFSHEGPTSRLVQTTFKSYANK